MRSKRRTVDSGGGSLASRHDDGSGGAPAGMGGPNGTPECKHPYAFAAGASHAFQIALVGICARLGKQARSLVSIQLIRRFGRGGGAPQGIIIHWIRDRKIDTRWCWKVGSICLRKLVPFLRFAAPVLVPENGHDLGAANRAPLLTFNRGDRFAAPKWWPFSGTKTGAANHTNGTSFLGQMEPIFWEK